MRHETVWTQHWKEHITDTVTEALMIKEESACKHPRNFLECSFNPPKPWLREVTANPAELSWQGEHSALIAEGKGNKNICSPRCPVTTSPGTTIRVHRTSTSASWSWPNVGHGHPRPTPRLQLVPLPVVLGRWPAMGPLGAHLAMMMSALKDDPKEVCAHHHHWSPARWG